MGKNQDPGKTSRIRNTAVDPHCFDADPEPDPDLAQNLDADMCNLERLF